MNIFLRDMLMITEIKVPDSSIARQAEELARSVSNDMLFNHVMRCYWFGELLRSRKASRSTAN